MTHKNTKSSEFIYGIHPVLECLQAKRRKIYSMYITKEKPKQWPTIEKLAAEKKIPIQVVTRETINSITHHSEHQGILAWVSSFELRKKPFSAKEQPFLLMLDGIQDPRNLGAILRTAYCTGVDGVIITQKNSAPLNAVAIKASAGLAEYLQIMVVPSAQTIAKELKKEGYELLVTSFQGQNATEYQCKSALCLIIGSESQGISSSLLKEGIQITLPQKRADISYNASVAAGILLFMISTQLKKI